MYGHFTTTYVNDGTKREKRRWRAIDKQVPRNFLLLLLLCSEILCRSFAWRWKCASSFDGRLDHLSTRLAERLSPPFNCLCVGGQKRRRSLLGVPNHPSPPSDLSPNNKIHSVRDYIIQRKWRRAEISFVVRYSILVPFRGYYVEKKQNLSLFDSSVVCVCVCRRWPISYAVTHLLRI